MSSITHLPYQVDNELIRFRCLEELIRKLLKQFIAYSVTNQTLEIGDTTITTSNDKEIALAEILKSRSKEELTGLFKHPKLYYTRKEVVFPTNDPLVLSDNIVISDWDTKPLCILLTHISWFRTCGEKFRKRMIQCTSVTHKNCCVTCDHGDKKYACATCETPFVLCNKGSIPCCTVCKLCVHCAASSNFCDSRRLRTAIEIISKLRNLIAHSTPFLFEDMREGTMEHSNFPLCHDFKHLWRVCTAEVLFLSTYLYRNGAIDSDMHNSISHDVHHRLPVMVLEQFYTGRATKLKMYFKLNEIKTVGLMDWIFCWSHTGFVDKDCAINSPVTKTVYECVTETFSKIFEPRMYRIDLRVAKLLEVGWRKTDIRYKCVITNKYDTNYDIPIRYQNSQSWESLALWKKIEHSIKTSFLHNLNMDINVTPLDWIIGSINIDISLTKVSEGTWQQHEIVQVDKVMEDVMTSVQLPDSLEIVSLSLQQTIQYEFEIFVYDNDIVEEIIRFLPAIEKEIINKMICRKPGTVMPGMNIPKTRHDSNSSSHNDTPLSSSAPDTMEFNNDHYNMERNRHSFPVFDELESSLPTDLNRAFSTDWLSRTLNFSRMISFFRSSSSKEVFDDDMPEIFPDMKKLEKEKVIKIKSNKLKEIPDTLQKLKSVEELRITRSKFKKGDGIITIPLSISKLNKLRILDLRGNPLGTVTLAISHLKTLEELTLESCNLTEVPLINELQNLTRVILDNNKISNPKFSLSSNISYLSLVNNSITEYPKILPSNLVTLDLSENYISVIPDTLLTMNSALTKLYLRENHLEYLPATITKLDQLKVFDVSKNLLRQLPDDIGLLTSLVSLNISYNELTTLPKTIINLCNNNTNLLCGENPLQKPPIEVGLQGLHSIKNYFKALEDSEEVKNKRLKLMLLGDARAGKTFLAKALYTCKEPDACEDETIGIDCFHWKHRLTEGDTLEVLIVDCAGQKKYMLTHQLFLSTGMVFAVVVNLAAYKMEEYQEKIGFWIELIIARVPNATILIVPTHLDKMSREDVVIEKCTGIIEMAHDHIKCCKNEARKMSVYEDDDDEDSGVDEDLINPTLAKYLKFNKLEDVAQLETKCIIDDGDDNHTINMIPVSSRYTLPGLALLREEIVNIANNKDLCPNIHRCVPESWTKLEQYCIQERKNREKHPIITIEEIAAESNCLNSQEDYKEALRFVDSMGHILFFENDCCNLILLDPRWLFQLMKLLFTHNADTAFSYKLDYCVKFDVFKGEFLTAKNILLNSALLSDHLLRCIWSDYISDEKLFNQVVFLFKTFDLFYEVANSDGLKNYLVSWFLKDERPADIKQPAEDKKALIVTRFETIGVLPDGFFQRFITRIYAKHILESCAQWNYGFKGLVQDGDIMCEYGRADCSSYIMLKASSSPANIYHMWKTIIPILKVLEHFMKDWKGIKHLVYSVCPSCYISGQDSPHLWRLDTSKLHTKMSMYCQTELERVDKWVIYPPPGILKVPSDEEKERMNRKDMDGWLENDFKVKNKISEKLITQITELENALDAHLGEREASLNSRNAVLEIIKLWEQKSKKVSKKLFIKALQTMRPYPVDVVEILME